ncbi:TIGR02186 family protein [Sediminimonas sp.]|uniref:TIGR02186 family protein n=1 Tax=Sediminimonas sp. TaxID=2823379 RepID=UPI0025F7A9DF|nr:TIGR02186 family protein [Sediminimonas sp.]
MRYLLSLLALFLALAAQAEQGREEVVLGLSQTRVSISTNFDGSEVLVFGAIKRETQIPRQPLEVIVTIAGPSEPLIVRRKDRRVGIWINTAENRIDSAPSYYAVATSGPLKEVLRDTEDLRHKITITRAIRSVGAPADIGDARVFTRALIRIRQKNGLYQTLEGAVKVDQQTLFRTSIALPANLTEGPYRTRVFLTRGGHVISTFETEIDVYKVGIERFLYKLSRNQPLSYGLLSLAIAIVAGWTASAVFRFLRQG